MNNCSDCIFQCKSTPALGHHSFENKNGTPNKVPNGELIDDSDQQEKFIRIHTTSKIIEEHSDNDSNDKSNDVTYTKSDEEYAESFEKESKESSNETNGDYNDDNDLVN